MALSLTILNGGPSVIGGLDMVAVGTITWDAATAAAGENLGTALGAYFSSIDAIMDAGTSTIGMAVYPPRFIFTPGGAIAADDDVLAVLLQVPAIGDAGEAAQPLECSTVDAGALGTTQFLVFGKGAIS